MRKLIFIFYFIIFSGAAFAQEAPAIFDLTNYGVRIEPDKRVMIVLAALAAARVTDKNGESVPVLKFALSPKGGEFNDQLISDLAAINEKLRDKISAFVIQYKRRNPDLSDAELLAPFISMAYSLSPPPDLADPVVTSDLPGTLLDVLDFAPLARDFFRQSVYSAHLEEYFKSYQSAANANLRSSARDMVAELLTFLQTRPQLMVLERTKVETRKVNKKKSKLERIETRERERHFYIVPEMLAPVGNVNFLNIRDDYYVIVPPDTDLNFSDVRRGYLQFVIDPIVLSRSKEISTIRDGVRKLLDERRKTNPATSPDVFLAVSRSIVAAIDSKQVESERIRIATERARRRIALVAGNDEKLAVSAELEAAKNSIIDDTAARLWEDYEKGAVLVFYFSEQLKGIEDSGFDIVASMREMILSFKVDAENTRPAKYEEARKRSIAARAERRKNPNQNNLLEDPVTTRLIEIEETIANRNYSAADSELKSLLVKNPDEPRVYYNIGRVASFIAESYINGGDLEKQKTKLLEAKVAYERVLRIAEKQRVDTALISLSYFSLAKIYEFYNEKGYAMSIYEAAIKLGPVTGGAYNEALMAKQRLVKDQ